MDYLNEKLNELLINYEEKLSKRFDYLKNEFITVRAGRVDTRVVERVTIDYFGTMTPIKNLANISCTDARTIVINPWDGSVLATMIKALAAANLGTTPVDDGRIIRLVFPQLTAETRKELVKKVHKIAEDTRVSMRNERRDAMDQLKKISNADKISEDEVKNVEHDIQKMLDDYIGNIDAALAQKEKDIMTI
ncbi:MAG: ribosome recycling factor [Eubacteriales bacterium]|nr:ribosome recycling factor [Eubacteriales bacterium]